MKTSRSTAVLLTKLLLAAAVIGAIALIRSEGSSVSAEPAFTGAGDPEPEVPFSTFRHTDPQHQRLPCLLCHNRADNSPRIKRSGHTPCSGCHVEQFTQTSGPLCSICHTETGVKPFPPLRSFNAKFDHGRHQRQTDCATCHRPTRGGAALSIPAGSAAHSTCFSCHTAQKMIGGKNIGSCDTCHSPGRLVRTSEWSKAYAVNFNHAEHARGRQSCAACHTVKAGAVRSRQVTAPLVSMHFAPAKTASCASCHNNKKAFGPEDFRNCKRCHEGATFKF